MVCFLPTHHLFPHPTMSPGSRRFLAAGRGKEPGASRPVWGAQRCRPGPGAPRREPRMALGRESSNSSLIQRLLGPGKCRLGSGHGVRGISQKSFILGESPGASGGAALRVCADSPRPPAPVARFPHSCFPLGGGTGAEDADAKRCASGCSPRGPAPLSAFSLPGARAEGPQSSAAEQRCFAPLVRFKPGQRTPFLFWKIR